MRTLLLLLIFSLSLFGNSLELEAKILSFIVDNISTNQEKIVFSDDTQLLKQIALNTKVTTNCQDASIVIVKDKLSLSKECLSKKLFVLDYDCLEKLPTSFGAFFFKKGRANIVFIEPRLEQENIHISKKLQPYLEDRIW